MKEVEARFSNYDRVFESRRHDVIFAPHVLDAVIQHVRGNVLDIGTGDGYKLRRVIEQANKEVSRVTALEPSPLYRQAEKELRRCEQDVNIVNASLESFPPSRQFDTVLMFEVLEHVPVQKRAMFVNKVKRLLRPNGRVILSTPNRRIYHAKCWLSGEEPDPTHTREFTYPELRCLLARHFECSRILCEFPWAGLFRYGNLSSALDLRTPPWLSHVLFAIAGAPTGQNTCESSF